MPVAWSAAAAASQAARRPSAAPRAACRWTAARTRVPSDGLAAACCSRAIAIVGYLAPDVAACQMLGS